MLKMIIAASFLALATNSALATTIDLELPGERWLSRFDRYVCDTNAELTEKARTPAALESIRVNFEQLSTDRSLRSLRILATFEEEGVTCRFSALATADIIEKTVKINQSQSFAPAGGSACENGHFLLNRYLGDIKYIYYSHRPHRVALMMPAEDSAAICPGKDAVGVDFAVIGLKPGQTR